MEYTLKVSDDDLNVIAAGLNELPRKVSQPVFARLEAQVQAQVKARAAEVEAHAKAEQELPVKVPEEKPTS